jgi:hypothetical protein
MVRTVRAGFHWGVMLPWMQQVCGGPRLLASQPQHVVKVPVVSSIGSELKIAAQN